jgi:hypothetical protein
MNFVCTPCGKNEHENCPGAGQCDCQHRVKK